MLELYLRCNSAFHTSVAQVTGHWSSQIKGRELCMGSNDGAAERKNMRENESQWKSKLPLVSILETPSSHLLALWQAFSLFVLL